LYLKNRNNIRENMPLPFLQQKPESMKKGVPVDRVTELSSKGFSEVDIIDILRKEGYSPDEIDAALTEALKLGVSGISPPAKDEVSLPKLEELQPKKAPMEVPETSLPQDYSYYSTPYYVQPEQAYPSEDYIELLVKEKTAELDDKLKEFMIKYSELEKRFAEVHEQLNEIAKAKRTAEDLILVRLDEVKSVLTEVETRLSGVEKAFKDTLPALIESVRALSDVVQKMKKV
jgi:DNA-binding transcriptional MerR regulator